MTQNDIRLFGATLLNAGFLPGIFFRGEKSIVMQISFVTLIFLSFLDQILRGGGQKSMREELLEGALPVPPVEESQNVMKILK